MVFRGLQERFRGAIKLGEVEDPLGVIEVAIVATYSVDDSAGIVVIKEIESKKSVHTLAVAMVKVKSADGSSCNWDGEHTFTAEFRPTGKTRRSEDELLGHSVCKTAAGLREEILKKPKLKFVNAAVEGPRPTAE